MQGPCPEVGQGLFLYLRRGYLGVKETLKGAGKVGMRSIFFVLVLLLVTPAAAQQAPQSRAEINLSFAPLVKEAAPAVVNIYAKVIRAARRSPFAGDPFFERFFGDLGAERPRVQNSLGSGVILSADGIVVSNYHVVGNATDIRVVLADRREFAADVLLADEANDLAILLLRDAGGGLPHLNLRASDTVEVGELVLAIGNPFGVGQTVSSGIVSGLARSGAARGRGRGYFIQTDAPINPGNSGGALIDVSGRLLGVNTSILTRSGGSNGIGFAIPADLVAAFVAQARDGRDTFGRPWAGIRAQRMEADIAEAFGLDVPAGVVVSALHPDSPFAQAGVARGDVITAVAGGAVNSPSEMLYRLSVIGLGNTAVVDVYRDGRTRKVTVLLAEAPDVPTRQEIVLGREALLEGMRLVRINPAVIVEFGLPLEAQGVLVAQAGALGQRAGLRQGDVIEAINQRLVNTPRDAAGAFSDGASRFLVTVVRDGRRISIRFRV